MTHLGDITKINGAEIPPVDVITFGAPCQDISIAGARKGMKHTAMGDTETTRSGLFYEAVRIIKEMRDATNGEYPKYAVYENVPGAFSSNKGEDFRCVLEELAKIEDPGVSIPQPDKGKWRTAGAIVADGYSLAWRVMDSQWFGVPQRRRRITLVADFRGQSAPQILFDEQGLHGDIATGREAGQGTAADAQGSAGSADTGGCLPPGDVQDKRIFSETGVAPTMSGCDGGGGRNPAGTVFCLQGNAIDRDAKMNGLGVGEDVSYTLNTVDKHAIAFKAGQGASARSIGLQDECAPTLSADAGGNTVPAVCYSLDCRNHVANEEISGTLQAKANGGQSLNYQNPVAVYDARGNGTTLAVLPFDTTQITSPQNGNNPQYGDPCHPLCATAHTPSVVEKKECWPATARTLAARHDSSPCVDRGQNVICMATGQANAEITEDVAPTLNCAHEQPIAASQYRVRRLTPLECERLQGYPDGWTSIPDYVDNKGKTKKVSDSARYKALGNSIALPPWRFVLGQISAYLPQGATLGSLFDGIGGFPLIWEEIQGRGTARWASEIEEFPIAVTKYRFPAEPNIEALLDEMLG